METLGKYDSNFRTKDLGLWSEQAKGAIHKLQALRDLNIMQTPNTTRTCYTCRGSKWLVLALQNGHLWKKPCDVCKGAGVVHN